MKAKMIYSDYDPESKTSIVKIANILGMFTGYAKCHPEDTASSFLGCHIAEYRAYIKALKYEANLIKAQIDVLHQTYAMFEDNKNFNPNGLEARKIRKMIYIKENKRKDILEQIESLKKKTDNLPANREKVLRKMREGKCN